MATSTSKLHVVFSFDHIDYYANDALSYFAKKGENDARITRISRANYEAAKAALDAELASIPTPAPVDPAPVVESVPASDPTPATVATVEAAPVTVDPSPVSDPILDAVTRPDWAAQATFERVTLEDLQAVPGIVARGLGVACMATLKVAAMGLGALMGLGLMGLRRCIAR